MERFEAAVAALQDGQPSRMQVDGLAGALAEALGASGWTVCATARRGDAQRLVPLVDGEPSGVSEFTRAVTRAQSEPFGRVLVASRLPVAWPRAEAAPSWLRGIDALPGIAPGIGFPVITEAGRSGAVLFAGGPAVVDGGLLLAAHNACHALFEAACRLKAGRPGRRPSMSAREIECLRLTAHGLTSDQIASRLGLSVHTANRYLSNTVEKLDAANRMHAVAKALRAGLID